MAKRGRKVKLSDEIADKIVLALLAGNYLSTAAAFAGVHRDTVHDWMKKGEQPGPYREFAERCHKAMAEAEVAATNTITKGVRAGDGRLAMKWLERRYPGRYGVKSKTLVQGDPGAPIQHEHRGLQITIVQANAVDAEGRLIEKTGEGESGS